MKTGEETRSVSTTTSSLSEILCEYAVQSLAVTNAKQVILMMMMILSTLYHQSIECKCVNSVLPDLWTSSRADMIPNNQYNPNLFDHLYTLAHVLLTDPDKNDTTINNSITSQNGKRSLSDVTSYPVCVRTLNSQRQDHPCELR